MEDITWGGAIGSSERFVVKGDTRLFQRVSIINRIPSPLPYVLYSNRLRILICFWTKQLPTAGYSELAQILFFCQDIKFANWNQPIQPGQK